jgi:uncharacterized protein YndB with AHSA1/START domain
MPGGDFTSVVIERTLTACIDRVFDALTNPASLAQWWGMKGSQVICCETDVVVGGKWRIGSRKQDNQESWVHGIYQEVLCPKRLVFTWSWEPVTAESTEMLVTIDLIRNGHQTHIKICHEKLPSDRSRQMHAQGWNDSLEALIQLLLKDAR